MDELINSADPLRIVWMAQTIQQLYEIVSPLLTTLLPGLIVAGLVLCFIYGLDILKTFTGTLGSAWTRIKLFLMPKFVQNYLQGRAMRKKRETEQDERGVEAISDWIEAEVDEGTMTRIEANQRYAQLAKFYPGLAQCIEWFKNDNPKERMLAERAHRAAVGDTVVPLPKEGPGKIILRRHQR